MNITEVRIVKILKKGNLLGYANIVIDDCFTIKGIKLIETEEKGRFISMPSKRLKRRNVFRDVCHPINQGTRDKLTEEIFEKYDEEISKIEE